MALLQRKEEEAERTILQIGNHLSAFKTCPNKDTLVKLLKQATHALPDLKQSESLKVSVKPLSDSLFKHGLLKNRDKDIRILVGTCLCEVIRILAPNPDFSYSFSRDIFAFLISIFGELDDTASPYFSRKVKLLETIAKLQFCLLMLDIESEGLILEMFRTLVSVVRDDHPQCLINSMASILASILEEKLETDTDPTESNTQPLLDVILKKIVEERKGLGSASSELVDSIIKACGGKLEYHISEFLTSCILNRDAVGSAIKESYHDIILELFQITPRVLLSVIPHLTHELQTNQVDVRIKALNLIKKLLALRGQHVVQEYPHIFIEMLNRFSDKSAEVRLAALSCARALYMTSPSATKSPETLSAIQGRLLDHVDNVRIEAVSLVCDITKANLNFESSDLVTHAAERLRDKKVSVRSKALKKLVELYHEYCTRCAADITLRNDIIEEIPCKILLLCYEKDCHEYRPQSIELVLSDLFPASLSIEERMKHWVFMSSLFKPLHIKALKVILSQKRRLRDGLKEYLDFCNQTQTNGSRDGERELEALIRKMSSCFPDPAKTKDLLMKFKEGLDAGVVGLLQQSLSEGTALDTEAMKDLCIRELGDQRVFIEFLHQLSKKCSFNIFGPEHVRYIIDSLSSGESSEQHLKYYLVQLLLTIIGVFPSLLRGFEKQFQHLLLEREIPFNEQMIEILARGQNMPIKLSDIYLLLENICLEGTRVQSKLAVSAIVALADTSEQLVFPKLCKALVDALHNGCNIPTVLQSIGCMAQHSIPAFEDQEKAIGDYIVEEIFHQNDALASKNLGFPDDDSDCCTACKLKILGLKALVRSFLPHQWRSISRPVSFVLDIIQQMLQKSGIFASSMQCDDGAFIRLAAAKSVLRLSRKWDLHISQEIFRLTILTTKDHSPDVHRSFIRKVHKLLSNHTLPSRYACAFSFIALDPFKDLRTEAIKYLEDFIREYDKGAKIHETMSVQRPTHPVYIIVYLIHVLAHDCNFPAADCHDDKIYAQFLSPLFVTLRALVNKRSVDANLNLASNASDLRIVFNAIKKAEDAVDSWMTPKLHLLAEVGISILDSLNIVNMDEKHSPGSILLPSSLYKSASAEMKESDAYKVDASFVKNLVLQLRTEVSRIDAMDMHPKQVHENSLRTSGRRHTSRSNSKSGHTHNLSIDTTKEQIDELHSEEREKHNTPSGESEDSGRQNGAKLSNLGSAVLHERSSAENEQELGGQNTTKTPSISQQEFFVSSSGDENAPVKFLDANNCNPSKENFPRNKDTCARKSSRAGKRTKHSEDSSDTLKSNITNLGGYHLGRRTRRQKV